MYLRILKRELGRKKGINLILFLFMVLATVFVASSVNNILVVSRATDYCMKKGNVPDETVFAYDREGERSVKDWLEGEGRDFWEAYTREEMLLVGKTNIVSYDGKQGESYEASGSIMLQAPWTGNLLLFDQEQNPMKIQKGEIAMQKGEMEQNGLEPGDSFVLKYGDYEKTLTLSEPMLDPAFGGDYIGTTRYLVSQEDFDELKEKGGSLIYCYGIETADQSAFSKEMNRQGLEINISIERSMFAFTYIMSSITAGILIVIGVCLIVIAFLILRFTLLFTMQEEYKEIGIMKAIGIRNNRIKQIYLVKYFVLALAAAVIGFFLSIPVSGGMLKQVSESMVMESGDANLGINVLCSLGVLGIVLLFCYLSTGKIKKYSVMETIRSGQTGERYRKSSAFALHRGKKRSVPFFLAVNDIFSGIRRYLVMILTFALGALLMILSVNTVASLDSKEMARNFMLDDKANVFVDPDSGSQEMSEVMSQEGIQKSIDQIQKKISEAGYKVSLHTEVMYNLFYYLEDETEVEQFMSLQTLNADNSYVAMLEGTYPKLENEIAMSEMVLQQMGLQIGDSVHVKIGNAVKDMLISGSYQNFMQMGKSVLLNEKLDMKKSTMAAAGLWYYQCSVKSDLEEEELIADLKKKVPELEFLSRKDILNKQTGSVTEQLQTIKAGVIVLVCVINILITVLMMKIFIMSERGQIAMLRSMGFSLRAVRTWQVQRMGTVLMIGVLIGICCSTFLNNLLLRPIFGMMGATHMEIQINPLEVYLAYPLLLLAVTMAAAYVSSGAIRKMNLMEINNIE